MTDRADQLQRIELFTGLKPEAVELIAQVATEESHALGTKIFQHGDAGDKLYLILEGRVRISREVPGMGEEALAVLGPGQVFGEMALLDESPRSPTRGYTSAAACWRSRRTASTTCSSSTRIWPTRCSGASFACWSAGSARRPTSLRFCR
jgi:CRP-like cAMP-binding protein